MPQTASFFILCECLAPAAARAACSALGQERRALSRHICRTVHATGVQVLHHACVERSDPQAPASPTTHPHAPTTAPWPPADTLFVGLIGRALGALRLFGLLIYAFRSAFAATPRARARAWQLQTCAFGGRIPDQTIIMLLGTVFSCIQ